ncbi:MAG: T9SS type A sorting domain-containing protein, partial [Flavobacteriales bacterium]|nr:T9SS type A sorting domain-containing protein [Flavobacteriales bacterium]
TKDHKVINFGADVFDDISLSIVPSISSAEAAQAGLNATEGSELTASTNQGLFVLPIAKYKKNDYKLVYEVIVDGKDPNLVPASFYTLVDALTGDVLRQFNMYHTHAPKANIEATVTTDVYPASSYDTPVAVTLDEMRVRINGTDYFTDAMGTITTAITTAATGTFFLDGPWVEINTSGSVPSFAVSLSPGANAISFDADALDTERKVFFYVNRIHEWVNANISGFSGMDYQVTVNMDQTGTCNASFGGGQMNFFLQGGGCYSLATIADVVYHEYGHGTNTAFYADNGGFFQNGAMGEGYADVWGFSLTEYPVLGEGMSDTDPTQYIRRYDVDPKIYPDDLVGQVHADGEIIAGAWWDLYLNLDSNMTQTMDLFELAYYGLQATTPDGQEGSAYRDVLLDVLEADDDDGNIGNGTPNMADICDAFGQHGITLISNATLTHTDVTAASVGQTISIDASLNLSNTTYLGDVMMYYRLKDATTWIPVVMANTGGSNYSGDIPGQVAGAIVEYYIGVTDNTCGNVSAVRPVGADAAEPTLPYYVLIDYQQEDIEDFDNNSFAGAWTYGIPSDQAVTGMWSLEVPEGMYDNGYELAPTTQATPGGFSCAVTQLNTDKNNDALIGEKDVDDGATTLLSPTLDLTGYFNPVITYRRWFANASPSSANPGNDPWYVEITADGTTWVPIEFTYVGDDNWRRYAFNVLDFILPTASVQLKFQVSDSIILALGPPGCGTSPFCGGSLLEAALDDIAIWSQTSQPVQFTVTNTSCNTDCDGELTATPGSGTAPFTYAWTPGGQTTATIAGLCAGVYQVTTIDAFNDTLMATVVVSEPAVLAGTVTGTNTNCASCLDGGASISVTGGTTPYSYLWSEGQTTSSIGGLSEGTYSCVVTDVNGCTFNSGNVTVIIGIEEVLLEGSLRVYPNPVRDNLQLAFTLLSEESVKVSIVNYLGELVQVENIGSVSAGDNVASLNMSHLASGVYTVNLLVGDQIYSHKVNLIY